MPVLTAATLLLSLLLSACQPVRMETPRPTGGEVLVYFQPLPPGAERLRFALAAVAAVSEDGTVHPLELHLPHLTDQPDRQHLLASGRLPEGLYSALLLTVAGASLASDDGDAALLLTDRTVHTPVPFALPKGGATLLEVAYRHEGSIRQQFHFAPLFFAHVPEPPVASRMAFVSHPAAGRLTLFDRKTLQVTAALAVGDGAAAMVSHERLRRLYVALTEEAAVVVIDSAAASIIGRIPLQSGDRPERLALTPDGRLLLSANAGSSTVSFLEPQSQVEVARLPVGDDPAALLIDPKGRRAFIFNQRGNSISVLDLQRRQLIATVATDPGPFRGAFNRDGSRLFVIHRHAPYLTVVDTTTLTVREHLPIGAGASAILLDSRSNLLYLGRADLPRLDILDPISLQPVDFLETPAAVTELVIDDEENRLLIALPSLGQVAALDLVGKRVVGRVHTGHLHSLVLMGGRR